MKKTLSFLAGILALSTTVASPQINCLVGTIRAGVTPTDATAQPEWLEFKLDESNDNKEPFGKKFEKKLNDGTILSGTYFLNQDLDVDGLYALSLNFYDQATQKRIASADTLLKKIKSENVGGLKIGPDSSSEVRYLISNTNTINYTLSILTTKAKKVLKDYGLQETQYSILDTVYSLSQKATADKKFDNGEIVAVYSPIGCYYQK